MAKVVHITLMLELADEESDPMQLGWCEIIDQIPEIQGFSFLHTEHRPYASMDEDPITHVKH